MTRVDACSEGEGSDGSDNSGAEGGEGGGAIEAGAGDGPFESLLVRVAENPVGIESELSFGPGIAELLGANRGNWGQGSTVGLGASGLPGGAGGVDGAAGKGSIGVSAGPVAWCVSDFSASPASYIETPDVAVTGGLRGKVSNGVSVSGGSEKGKCNSSHL